MFCSKCGASIQDGTKFCNVCGNAINGNNKENLNGAIWESISVQVAPAEENNTIQEYEWFGWELKSSQTIDRKSSHLEGGFNSIYSVTESVNYIKLVFKRNKNMKNYRKIKELEDTYRSSYTREMPKGPSIIGFMIGWFIGIPALISALLGNFALIGGLLIAIPLIVVFGQKI